MARPDEFAAGSIYYLPDQEVRLPGNEERVLHVERRPVLIISDQNDIHGNNRAPSDEWPSVLVVPISHSTKFRTKFDVRIAAAEGNLGKKGWARIPAVQLVDKELLQDMTGQVETGTLDAVTAQLLDYLGVIEPETTEEEPY